MQGSVTAFGEVLWDIFPGIVKIGGAPLNVAYNLKKQGVNSYMISKVGKDALGSRILDQLTTWGIPAGTVQTDADNATGTVNATIDEHNEAHYEIVEPVAWDFIEWNDQYETLIKTTDAFLYGSLITRNQASRNTLFTALEIAPFKVFDVNFRPPFFSWPVIKELLQKADLVKMNKAELRQLSAWMGQAFITEEDNVCKVQEVFDIPEILLTKGSRGAAYYDRDQHYEFEAVQVAVKDTVGSGDAFLAGFLAEKIRQADVTAAMTNATALGAFITMQEGACPDYSLADFTGFKTSVRTL